MCTYTAAFFVTGMIHQGSCSPGIVGTVALTLSNPCCSNLKLGGSGLDVNLTDALPSSLGTMTQLRGVELGFSDLTYSLDLVVSLPLLEDLAFVVRNTELDLESLAPQSTALTRLLITGDPDSAMV